MIHFKKCSLILILTARQVHGKYLKFVLLSFDTVLVPCVAAGSTAEPVASDYYLKHGGCIFLQSLVSRVPLS